MWNDNSEDTWRAPWELTVLHIPNYTGTLDAEEKLMTLGTGGCQVEIRENPFLPDSVLLPTAVVPRSRPGPYSGTSDGPYGGTSEELGLGVPPGPWR